MLCIEGELQTMILGWERLLEFRLTCDSRLLNLGYEDF